MKDDKNDCAKEFKKYRETIDRHLTKALPSEKTEPKILHKAMRYSVFAGGKRLRPLIVLIVGDMLGVEERKILPIACGIELIHNFSLIHDDLPAMDNDDFRRGKQTCHKKFNEAVAILAGDALLTLGFKMIAETGSPELIKKTADAIGSQGMAGGQTVDILQKNKKLTERVKRNLDLMKTGKLFQLCFSAPLFFKKVDAVKKGKLLNISKNFGIAFQIRDDIEDREGDIEELNYRMETYYKKIQKDIAYLGKKGMLLSCLAERLFKV